MGLALKKTADTRPQRVLVVDDEPGIRQLLARHFRQGGAQVVVAGSAEEVAQRGHEFREWDVVVIDVHLPGRSGVELAQQLERRTGSLVLVTGDTSTELANEALSSVSAGYLLKPFELFELDAAVRMSTRMKANQKAYGERLFGANGRGRQAQEGVPVRALLLSVGALLVPAIGQLFGTLPGNDFLLWISALIPPFLLAYYRGWTGAAAALAMGMLTLVAAQILAEVTGEPLLGHETLLALSITLLLTSVGAGWLSSTLHQRRAEAEVSALSDPLTGLGNRARLTDFLDSHFAASVRNNTQLAAVFFDIDHFKQWNDDLGHEAGDEAIAAFADLLRRNTRTCNLTARYSGEEFVSILTATDYAGALIFADRMREAVRRINFDHGRRLTVSVGIAFRSSTVTTPADLLAAADAALYTAKAAGRDCVRVFQEASTPENAGSGDAGQLSLVRS